MSHPTGLRKFPGYLAARENQANSHKDRSVSPQRLELERQNSGEERAAQRVSSAIHMGRIVFQSSAEHWSEHADKETTEVRHEQ